MPSVDPERMRLAEAALAKVAGQWMSRSGVIAVEVARRWKGGAPTDEVGVRVTVARGSARAKSFPETVDGVPVDVVEGSPPRPER